MTVAPFRKCPYCGLTQGMHAPGCPALDDEGDDVEQFKEGDLVEIEASGGRAVTATFVCDRDDNPNYVYVNRHDGIKGIGPGDSWLIERSEVKRVITDIVIFPFPTSQSTVPPAKKEWKPDGFDADAHRDFMRNLGS